jgi:hypothetical protein
MSNTVTQVRKLFDHAVEALHQRGGSVTSEAQGGLWVGLGLFLVADALQSVSTSIDNLGSEVRDCNDGVAEALKDIEPTLSKLVDAVDKTR